MVDVADSVTDVDAVLFDFSVTLFRLEEDRAVINRFGFNNRGAADAVERLRARNGRPGVIGVNISNNPPANYQTLIQNLGTLSSTCN